MVEEDATKELAPTADDDEEPIPASTAPVLEPDVGPLLLLVVPPPPSATPPSITGWTRMTWRSA